MQVPDRSISRHSVPLWIGTFLLITLSGIAASVQSFALIKAVIALSAAFALYGIGFGIWAAGNYLGQISPILRTLSAQIAAERSFLKASIGSLRNFPMRSCASPGSAPRRTSRSGFTALSWLTFIQPMISGDRVRKASL